jgi:hypothetical protein
MSGTLLADRLALPDMQGLPDWRAAELLNQPDDALPKVRHALSAAEVLRVLIQRGDWADVQIAAINGTPVAVRKAAILVRDSLTLLPVIDGANGTQLAALQSAVNTLVAAATPVITAATRDAIVARLDRSQSWAEANNVLVTARTVGIARGGVG